MLVLLSFHFPAKASLHSAFSGSRVVGKSYCNRRAVLGRCLCGWIFGEADEGEFVVSDVSIVSVVSVVSIVPGRSGPGSSEFGRRVTPEEAAVRQGEH